MVASSSGRLRSSAVQTAACSASQRASARSAATNEHHAYSPTVTSALSTPDGVPRSSNVSRSARSAIPTLCSDGLLGADRAEMRGHPPSVAVAIVAP